MDNTTYQILKLFYNNNDDSKNENTVYLSCKDVVANSEYNLKTVMQSCLSLRNKDYISTNDRTQTDSNTIYEDSFYAITVKGKEYFEKYEKRQSQNSSHTFIQWATLILAAISAMPILLSFIQQLLSN